MKGTVPGISAVFWLFLQCFNHFGSPTFHFFEEVPYMYIRLIKLLRVKCDAIDQFLKTKMNVFAKNRNGKLFPLKISYLNKVIFCTLLYPGYPGNVPIKNPKPGGLNTRLIGHLNHRCG